MAASCGSLTKRRPHHRVPTDFFRRSPPMLTRRATLAGFAALAVPSRGLAQGFPSRTITIVVPYPPGGPIDTLARLIAQEMAGDLKQPVVVENRPGGSGVI